VKLNSNILEKVMSSSLVDKKNMLGGKIALKVGQILRRLILAINKIGGYFTSNNILIIFFNLLIKVKSNQNICTIVLIYSFFYQLLVGSVVIDV
jgi:hypothetical protein